MARSIGVCYRELEIRITTERNVRIARRRLGQRGHERCEFFRGIPLDEVLAAADEVAVVGEVRWARELKVTPFMRWLERGVQFEFSSIRGIEASWAHLYSSNSSIKRSSPGFTSIAEDDCPSRKTTAMRPLN